MKVYFSHGKESGPWGSKIRALADVARDLGCAVASVDYTQEPDPDQRVKQLLELLKRERDDYVLVGSSMGGYVSLIAAAMAPAKGVFLLAPALYLPGYMRQDYPTETDRIEIVHGWSDSVIPSENSIKFARHADCTLHLLRGGHRLKSSLGEVGAIFSRFLASVAVFR